MRRLETAKRRCEEGCVPHSDRSRDRQCDEAREGEAHKARADEGREARPRASARTAPIIVMLLSHEASGHASIMPTAGQIGPDRQAPTIEPIANSTRVSDSSGPQGTEEGRSTICLRLAKRRAPTQPACCRENARHSASRGTRRRLVRRTPILRLPGQHRNDVLQCSPSTSSARWDQEDAQGVG